MPDLKLKSYIERIERLEADKKSVAEDIKTVYQEAKGEGYDAKVMRRLISNRAKDPNDIKTFEEVYALYKDAVGE